MEEAVRNGSLKQVQELIQSGADVNETCSYVSRFRYREGSLLHVAIEEGYQDIALALLAAGADVHAKDSLGWTPLGWACFMGFELVIQALIDRGSRVNEGGDLDRTPLMLADDWSNKAISMCLLRAGASCEGLLEGQVDCLFRHACIEGDLSAARTLLKNGCSVSILSREGEEKILHLACCESDVFVARTLLKNGCSVRKLTQKGILYLVHNLLKQEVEELLRHACREGSVFVVRTLIENGCSVSILSTEEQGQLLQLACCESDVFVAHTLLKNDCSVSILSTEEQEQLLQLACCESDVFVAHTLLKNDCSVSILSTEEQEQLLHLACCEKDVFVARALLKNGCSVRKLHREDLLYLVHNLLKQEVEELLRHACLEGSVFVVHTLIENGCTVSNLSTKEQEQLLHLACREGSAFVACTLVKNGCSVSILSTEEQEQLLHLSCLESDVFVTRTLLKNGCSVSVLSTEEQEQLLHLACCESDVFVARTLLQNGCSVSILSTEEQEELLLLASHESDVFVARTVLKNGCRVSILSTEEQEQLLHLASHEGDVFVARTLLENGCRVSILSTEEQEELLHLASCDGDVFVVRILLEYGCSVSILSTEEQEELLHHASCDGDVFVVRTLLENGCSVSILSTEEQEELLHHACHEGDVFVARTLLENSCSVSILSTKEREWFLYHACREGDVFLVEALLASGCNMNCVNVTGYTPLMVATEEGHEEVLKKLILAGANIGMQDARGDTALHLAASGNNIQCGILLAEGGASVRTKNKFSQTPLDLAEAEFKEAIKQTLSFTTRKALCIIGNAESGKSTLIAALQAESNSFLGKIFNRFRRVSDHRQRTAGIETVTHFSQRYGEVIFFDFAGQDDYHGPHQMFLESLLSKPGVSMTLLLVVKTTEEEEVILHQLHRWLSPVALMATLASPPQVIIIGSFLDKVKFKEEAIAKLTRCIDATREDLKELPLNFMGSSVLNCRQPQSKGIDQICNFFQEIPIPEFSATHTHYSLAWVLSHIRSSITSQAVQLQEFSTWIQDNKDNLPLSIPPPEVMCQDLSAAGHALYLPNREDPPKSWLVLDLASILQDVYGTLFSQSKGIVNEFGLLHCHLLTKLLRHLDLEMVKQLLISLEFCLPVDPSVLKVDLSKLTQSKEASGWLFFPALISAKPTQPMQEGLPQQSVRYLCWQLRTCKKHSISARLLQTILLRLAAHFVVKQPDEEGVHQHCCSIWWNGIAWQSKKGIDITIDIINNRVIQVIGASVVPADKSCQYLIAVISDILSTVHRLSPKLAAGAFIVHPPKMSASPEDITAPPPKELFSIEGIQNSIRDREEYSLSLKDRNTDRSTREAVSNLFGGCTPSFEDIGRINWPQPEPTQTQPNQPEPSQPDVLSWRVYSEFIYCEPCGQLHAILHYSFSVCTCV